MNPQATTKFCSDTCGTPGLASIRVSHVDISWVASTMLVVTAVRVQVEYELHYMHCAGQYNPLECILTSHLRSSLLRAFNRCHAVRSKRDDPIQGIFWSSKFSGSRGSFSSPCYKFHHRRSSPGGMYIASTGVFWVLTLVAHRCCSRCCVHHSSSTLHFTQPLHCQVLEL